MKSETQAAVGCLLYLIAAAGVLLLIAISVGIAVVGAIALVTTVVVAWLARQADAAATGISADRGYLSDLRDSVDSGIFADESARWLRPLSTYASVAAHRARLRLR